MNEAEFKMKCVCVCACMFERHTAGGRLRPCDLDDFEIGMCVTWDHKDTDTNK